MAAIEVMVLEAVAAWDGAIEVVVIEVMIVEAAVIEVVVTEVVVVVGTVAIEGAVVVVDMVTKRRGLVKSSILGSCATLHLMLRYSLHSL